MGNISLRFKKHILVKFICCWLFVIANMAVVPTYAGSPEHGRLIAIIDDLMIDIPSGEFDFYGNTKQVDAFKLAKYEVTQELYYLVMGNMHLYSFGDSLSTPVNGISRQHIDEFIAELNVQTGLSFRLPTEIEWSYAALGTASSDGVFDSTKVAEVGTRTPNGYGLYDMLGNVAEIVQEPWQEESRLSRQKPHIANDYQPGKTQKITIRGGSFAESASEVTPQSRDFLGTTTIMSDVGFRLAL